MEGSETLGLNIRMNGESFNIAQKSMPTCTERITTNCQPICTESLTRGCTEAPAPEPPQRNRFEGKYTFKHER